MVILLSYLLPFLEYLIKTITKSIKWSKKKKERERGTADRTLQWHPRGRLVVKKACWKFMRLGFARESF